MFLSVPPLASFLRERLSAGVVPAVVCPRRLPERLADARTRHRNRLQVNTGVNGPDCAGTRRKWFLPDPGVFTCLPVDQMQKRLTSAKPTRSHPSPAASWMTLSSSSKNNSGRMIHRHESPGTFRVWELQQSLGAEIGWAVCPTLVFLMELSFFFLKGSCFLDFRNMYKR